MDLTLAPEKMAYFGRVRNANSFFVDKGNYIRGKRMEAPTGERTRMSREVEELPSPESGRVTHIVHLADVHIRAGSREDARYENYSEVFGNLLRSLEAHPAVKGGTAVILVSGDVFHARHRLETAGIKLFRSLFGALVELAPVSSSLDDADCIPRTPGIPRTSSLLPYLSLLPS